MSATAISTGLRQFWLGGTTVAVEGTFTKTGSDGTGYINIDIPSSNDEAIFMYGQFASQTHAGGGDTLTVKHVTTAGDTIAPILTATVDANQTVNIPSAFADAAVGVGNDISTSTLYQCLISGTDRLRVEYEDMKFGTSETFTFYGRFRSRSGKALVVGAPGGTWT
jgi:hypothetical protein